MSLNVFSENYITKPTHPIHDDTYESFTFFASNVIVKIACDLDDVEFIAVLPVALALFPDSINARVSSGDCTVFSVIPNNIEKTK